MVPNLHKLSGGEFLQLSRILVPKLPQKVRILIRLSHSECVCVKQLQNLYGAPICSALQESYLSSEQQLLMARLKIVSLCKQPASHRLLQHPAWPTVLAFAVSCYI